MRSPDSALQDRVDRALNAAVSERRLVGGAVLVAHHGERVYGRAAGLADREARKPFTLDTIVRFASVTKLFVSVAALRMVDEGVIGLGDPVARWLPDFQPRLPNGDEAVILIRQLLTHTSGLGYRCFQTVGSAYDVADISDGLDLPGRSLEDNLARIASVPLLAAPGSTFIYSVSTDVLGGVMQAATGRPLQDLVRSLVTDPCGMRDTGFVVTDVERLATPYISDSPEPRRLADGDVVRAPDMADMAGLRIVPSRVFEPASFPSGGSGMVGVADGVLTLLETVRRDAADDATRLLGQQAARSLFSGQIGALPYQPGKTVSFAGEVVTDPVNAATPQSVGTLSWGGAYGHHWFLDPLRELSVVIVTNTMIEGINGQVISDVRNAVYEA